MISITKYGEIVELMDDVEKKYTISLTSLNKIQNCMCLNNISKEKELIDQMTNYVTVVFYPEDTKLEMRDKLSKVNFKDYNIRVVNFSKGKDLSGVFNGLCAKTLDLREFDTTCVESMVGLFNNVRVDEILFGDFFKTNKVYNMISMFDHGIIKKLDISSFNTHNTKYMSSMFKNLNTEELILGKFDTSNVETMNLMFAYSNIKNKLDLTKLNTRKVKNAECMFSWSNTMVDIDKNNIKLVSASKDSDTVNCKIA